MLALLSGLLCLSLAAFNALLLGRLRARLRDLSRTRTLLAFQGRDPRQCAVDLATDSEAISAIHVLDLVVGHEDAVQHVPIASVFVKLRDPRGQKILDLCIGSMNESASPKS